MREVNVTLAGRQLTLVANFKASHEIAQSVGDPLTIMREAAVEAYFLGNNIPYEPKWRFTITNVAQLLWIGLKAAKSTMTLDEVQELVFEAGFLEAKEAAADYLARIAGPQPTETAGKTTGDTSQGN